MDYKEKYEQALDRAKEMYDAYRFSVDPSNFKPTDFEYIFPQLADNEDERIRKAIISIVAFSPEAIFDRVSVSREETLAWLEKQEDINSKEYVFRPLAGCCIESAATRAVQQQQLGHKVVLAFNGAYIPVEGKTANKIVKEYYSWLERQGEKEEPQVYETGNGEVITYSESEGYRVDEEDDDFIIYHPLKNGKGEYECIPYSFYGSLTSFSEDKDLIDFLRTCFYTEEECNEWIEQQKEQKSAEWSEEETKDLVHILKVLDDCYIYGKHDLSKTDYDNLTSTLKSLKGKCKGAVEHDKIEPKFKV